MSFFKKHFWKVIICTLFVIGMVIATFFDLQISSAVVDLRAGKYFSTNLFGRVCESLGVIPVYFLTAFASIVIFQNFHRREKQKIRNLIVILTVITSVVMLALMFKKVFGYVCDHYGFNSRVEGVWDYVAYFVFGVLVTALLIILTKKLSNEFLNKALCWAVIVMVTAGIAEAITHIIKPFSGRARYRTLNVLNDFSRFTPWYKFNGKIEVSNLELTLGVASDGYKSFPSGHSSAVAMLITLTALVEFVPSLNKKLNKALLYLAVFVGIVLVTFGRIFVGAHYLSDVLVGTFITFISYFASTKLFKFIFKKYVTLKPLNEKVRIIRLQEESL